MNMLMHKAWHTGKAPWKRFMCFYSNLCKSVGFTSEGKHYANEAGEPSPLMNMLMPNAWHTVEAPWKRFMCFYSNLCKSACFPSEGGHYANEAGEPGPLMNMVIESHSPSVTSNFYYVVFVCVRTQGGTRVCDPDMLVPAQESPLDFRFISS